MGEEEEEEEEVSENPHTDWISARRVLYPSSYILIVIPPALPYLHGPRSTDSTAIRRPSLSLSLSLSLLPPRPKVHRHET